VDLKECRIFLKDTGRILDAAREWMKAFGIEPYHMSRHTGVMRYLVLRHSKYYDGLMAGAVVALTPEEFEKRREDLLKLFEALRAVRPLASAYACLNKGVADVTLTEEILPLHGEGCIKERIGDIDYSLYPASFFQTNSSCCGRLYEAVKESLRRIGGNALDIYCGSGGITLQLAGIFDRVTGIDNSTRNIEYAVKNAASNRIKNAQFLSADAEKFLADSRKDGSLEDFAAMVVDPPRAGLGRKTRSIILENGAPRLVYVSCNPMTLADDLKELVKSYKIRKVMPVDMFPHTRHLEAVAVLERITR
jgi:23S rRNA (uracil1939-C5)-methyltransferase